MKCANLIHPYPITGGAYPLSHDTCRCHDMRCPWRFECERWKQRETGVENTPHADSMLDA